jgi:hypothetical protein
MQVRACRSCCMMFPFLTSRSSCRPKGIAASASLGREEHKLQNSSEPTKEFLLRCLTSSISSRHNYFKITICRSRPLNWIYVYVINYNNLIKDWLYSVLYRYVCFFCFLSTPSLDNTYKLPSRKLYESLLSWKENAYTVFLHRIQITRTISSSFI